MLHLNHPIISLLGCLGSFWNVNLQFRLSFYGDYPIQSDQSSPQHAAATTMFQGEDVQHYSFPPCTANNKNLLNLKAIYGVCFEYEVPF